MPPDPDYGQDPRSGVRGPGRIAPGSLRPRKGSVLETNEEASIVAASCAAHLVLLLLRQWVGADYGDGPPMVEDVGGAESPIRLASLRAGPSSASSRGNSSAAQAARTARMAGPERAGAGVQIWSSTLR